MKTRFIEAGVKIHYFCFTITILLLNRSNLINLQVWISGPSARNWSSQKKHHQSFGYRIGYWVLNQNSRPRTGSARLTLTGKSWKTHPEIFLKFSFSDSSHRPFYWKTHPFEFFDWNHIWYVTFGLDEFSSKTVCVTP